MLGTLSTCIGKDASTHVAVQHGLDVRLFQLLFDVGGGLMLRLGLFPGARSLRLA
jgi:hypothetical protein